MDSENETDRRRQEIERLLRFPGVGAVSTPVIASNLGVPPTSLDSVLEALEEDGVVVRMEDGRFTAPTAREQA